MNGTLCNTVDLRELDLIVIASLMNVERVHGIKNPFKGHLAFEIQKKVEESVHSMAEREIQIDDQLVFSLLPFMKPEKIEIEDEGGLKIYVNGDAAVVLKYYREEIETVMCYSKINDTDEFINNIKDEIRGENFGE